MQTRHLVIPCVVIALVLVASVGGVLLLTERETTAGPARMEIPSLLEHEEGGLRYTYHVLSGTESLFDVKNDPRRLRNLLHDRPEDARRMRASLEARLGVESLEELRESVRGDIEELEALGYL